MLALDLRLGRGISSTAWPAEVCTKQGKHDLQQPRQLKICKGVTQGTNSLEWQPSPDAAAAGLPGPLHQLQKKGWVQLRSWHSQQVKTGRRDASGAQSEGCPAACASHAERPLPADAVRCPVSVTCNNSLVPTSWAQQACQHRCRHLNAVPMPDDHTSQKHAVRRQLPACSIVLGRAHEHSSHFTASLLRATLVAC